MRRDKKHRVLRRGESIRADGKKTCLSLRELEKQIGYDLDQ